MNNPILEPLNPLKLSLKVSIFFITASIGNHYPVFMGAYAQEHIFIFYF